MALFAYAVSRAGFQDRWIDDVLRSRLRQMGRHGPMTPAASDRKMRKRGFAILVLCSFDWVERSGMAEYTSLLDGSSEVRVRFSVVSWGESIRGASAIVRHGRLKEMVSSVH